MSVFSDLLSEYITMKDVGVYPLSQFCGLDRSFMYKIINGKRNPSGEDVVRKMAQFMQLTPREKTDFMDAFYITQMGEEVYYRRKSVGELIETFSHREGKKEYIFHEAEIAKLELNGWICYRKADRGSAVFRTADRQRTDCVPWHALKICGRTPGGRQKDNCRSRCTVTERTRYVRHALSGRKRYRFRRLCHAAGAGDVFLF